MESYLKHFCVLSFATILVGCSAANRTNAAFNTAARIDNFATTDEAYFICIEKAAPDEIGFDFEYRHRLYESPSNRSEQFSDSHSHDFKKLENWNDRRVFGETRRVPFISHIVKSNGQGAVSLPYKFQQLVASPGRSQKTTEGFTAGVAALENWSKNDLRETIAGAKNSGKPFTHVFVMCMGWGNDQEESALRYRSITTHVRNIAAEHSTPIRPLIIGLTWPSGWLGRSDSSFLKGAGHLTSVFNKANDADEIAMLYVSPMIHEFLVNAVPESTPIVSIGHSFGARLLSRATYSKALLRKAPTRNVALQICLQPAYSARRWVHGESSEGAPYSIVDKPRHFITTSTNDKANPFAIWSSYAGGIRGQTFAEGHANAFQMSKWDSKANELVSRSLSDRTTPTFIDAKEIVIGNRRGEGVDEDIFGISKRDGHNDVIDREMGQLVYYLVATQIR